jgi:hypothetical protein
MTDHLAVDHLLDLAEEDLQRETGERVSEFAVRLSQRASGRGRNEPGDADTLPIFHALAMIGKGDLPQA